MNFSSSNTIRKAVFPIAGLGTRFLPATKAMPKEMLTVVDKPLIQYAVEEAYEAGIRQMIFVTGRTKRAVEDHFDTAYELENELVLADKTELLDIVQSVKPADMQCIYIRQHRALGLGHAVLCAKDLIGNEPFAVLLADELMVSHVGQPNVTAQLVEQYLKLNHPSALIAVQHVHIDETHLYGIVSCSEYNHLLQPIGVSIPITAIIEKPISQAIPSTLAVAGRYIFTPEIFAPLENLEKGKGGEIQLTDAIQKLLSNNIVYAYHYQANRYDCGSKLGYLQATVDLAKQQPVLGKQFIDWLKVN